MIEYWLPKFPDLLDGLRGKNLACWCDLDQPCHADVLIELANIAAAHPRHKAVS